MNILAIDSGNTRIKWGCHDGAAWTRVGALAHDEARDGTEGLAAAFAAMPAIGRIAVANVAGGGAARRIEEACAGLNKPIVWARSQPVQCGVVNRYEDPAQLGVDRWAALIGARQRQLQHQGQGGNTGACLVVGAGTATTADLLSAEGEFRGGVILPGFALMKQSLASNTAQLPFAEGAYAEAPRNTADAIETGVLHAQAGAIERMYAELLRGDSAGAKGALCLISGGAAARIAACLSIPHSLANHLVLDGLACIAEAVK